MSYVCILNRDERFVLHVCKRKSKAYNHYKRFECMRANTMSSYTYDRFQNTAMMVVLLWIVLCLFVSSPDLFIGAHAKKQGEDLADNDGDEDEGILFRWWRVVACLEIIFILFCLITIWMKPLVKFCICFIIMSQSINRVRVNVNEWSRLILSSDDLLFLAVSLKRWIYWNLSDFHDERKHTLS